MWIPNLTSSGLLAGAAALVATSPVLAAENYVLGVCQIARPESGAEINPTTNGDSYLGHYHNGDSRYKGFSFDGEGIKVTVIKRPSHGRVALTDDPLASKFSWYRYTPDADYIGKDRFVMEVERNGVKVRINYLIESVEQNELTAVRGDDGWRMLYCNPESWKISQSDFNPGTQDHAAWLQSAELSSLLANASQSLTGFQDLSGSSVGQTTGEGADAKITLDFSAAGHGWYIDPTPLDNTDDYLPTSNPNIWQAKAGSEAAGKMDMLSVLLHEYGHALGLEHAADSADYMAATLQPGQRRLPSSEELSLMSQLLAQLKASAGLADGSEPTPTLPNPSAPLGAVLIGRLALGRRPEDEALASSSQALFSANPTLQGGSLATLQDWATQGKVVAESVTTGNANSPTGATLAESTTSQTRLNQVFMLKPEDRYLSFTLRNLALDDAEDGPDDAFEAALLNANTGANLLKPLALSHTDALLNLQAGQGGTGSLAELAAQGVSHVTHPDGSRTYLVDLSGIARDADGSVAVNLSFDLIGFGNTPQSMGSHVQVSDVRLLGAVQTVDDSASTAEDTAVAINLIATDVDSTRASLQFAIQTQPQRGSLVHNADGRTGWAMSHSVADGGGTVTIASGRGIATSVSVISVASTGINSRYAQSHTTAH